MKNKVILCIVLIILLIMGSMFFKEYSTETSDYEPIAMSTILEKPIQGCVKLNEYPSLSIPTQITKIEEDYFLVDCYHNQILTSDSLERPLTEWMVLTDQINRGHTIAGDGIVYLADDTENNRVLIFERKDGLFFQTQLFENIGERPHFITYDEKTSRFYVLSSMNDEMYIFKREKETSSVYLEQILKVPELENVYIRSFTMDDKSIYFVACNGQILCTSKKDLSLKQVYSVPEELAGMVQLTKIQDYYYLTVSTDLYGDPQYATIVRTKNLEDFSNGVYEDISDMFAGEGTPYYISCFDDAYYMTQHCMIPGTGVYQFEAENNELKNVSVLYP